MLRNGLIPAMLLLVAACGSNGDSESRAASTPSASEESAQPAAQTPEPDPEPTPGESPQPEGPLVRIETNKGTIVVRLDAKRAPKTTANFLQYVRDGHYDGTIFHRVIDDFMIQGGGFTPSMEEKPTRDPIELETHPELIHEPGVIAMARTSDPDSAAAQFYLTDARVPHLDGKYAVFGKVVEGMDVVERISATKTGPDDKPAETIRIESVKVDEK